MDEFNKIKQLSDSIVGRKEPTFDDSEVSDTTDEPFRFDALPEGSETLENLATTDGPSFKGHLIALGVFVFILALILTGFFMFGDDKADDEIITITATPTPVKVRPEQPGGMPIPDQDKQIYSLIQTNRTEPKVEALFPEPEKPVLPDIPVAETQQDSSAASSAVVPVVVEEVPPVPKKEIARLNKPTTAPVAPAKAAEKSAVKTASADVWRVQLLSTSKKQTAEKAWPTILKKHKALLSDMSHDVVSAQISGKGTFYRLWVGHFGSRDRAAALCAKLKARKQECVPVKGTP